MSEIQFKTLSIDNFLSIGEGALSLDNRGLLLIQGQNNDDPSANSNGAGKSSVVDALCWALYGETARGLTGDAVVNRTEGKNCRVSITFELNGRKFEVVRHRKHSKGKNRLMFYADGVDMTLGTDALTQELVEKTIGCNLDVFTASIYAAQDNMPNLPAMTDKALKQLVEKAAGIELLDEAYRIACDRRKTATLQRDNALAQLESANKNVERMTRLRSEAELRKNDWVIQQQDRIKKMTGEVQQALLDAQARKKALEAIDENALNQEKARLEAELAKPKPIPEEVPDPEPPKLLQRQAYPGLPTAIVELDRKVTKGETVLAGAKRDLTKLEDELANVNALVGQPCGECGKEYCQDDIHDRATILQGQIEAAKNRIAGYTQAIAKLREELDAAHAAHQAEIDKIDQHNKAVDERNEKLQRDYAEARREAQQKRAEARRKAEASDESASIVAALRDVSQRLSERARLQSEIQQRIEAIKRMRERIAEMQNEANPYESGIETAQTALNDALAELEARKQEANEADDLLMDVATAAELFSPKGMRGEILDNVTPFLNQRTAAYLGVLSDGQISAEWKTVALTGKGEAREKFHIEVTSVSAADGYEGLSGGEKRKVRVATAMALQDLVASRADRPIKLFIADEADDALDVSGLERLMTILDEKARQVGTVLVISHNDLGDWISNNIAVMKDGGKSHIIEV